MSTLSQQVPDGVSLGEAGCSTDGYVIPAAKVITEGSSTQLSSAIQRRKQQNRLRQKAWRQRRSAARAPQPTSSINDIGWQGYGMLITETVNNECAPYPLPGCNLERPNPGAPFPVEFYCKETAIPKLIPPFLPYSSHNKPSEPSAPLRFPLSSDHCLITLVQYNTMRAMLFNLSILSMMDCVPLGCGRSLQIPNFGLTSPDKLPPDLQPTPLQRSVPHAFWIRTIPFPRLRDNMISMTDLYDSNDLMYDMVLGLYQGFDDAERRGHVVWGDSWSADGWELSEGFVKKWGFLLAGCIDVIESSNRWRELRGEEKLLIV
ncbi:hypothetical protein B0I35DRAFT_444193 [Stachybotrys elegans]|uniref:BZIP domain-containing protein n=1 Tax=Stachybotrys elegans TaxID=80388 RepID=A0A8K0WK35_9HYPO|nr:hypothetical protein B0I35DRAFT_444193 [Stachybotrys elegans]